MPAYVIVDVQINDPVAYEEYKRLTPATIAAFGGKFIVRGGVTETLEGDGHPGRLVILSFPSREKSKEWWSSSLYSEAKLIRQMAATSKMIVADGFE